MKRIIIVTTFFISFVNAFSQENEDRTIENNDSIYINDETISKTINTDKTIILPIDPTVSSWVNNNGFLYYNGGNVGIGTSTPSYKLQTQGDIYANGGWLRVSGSKGLLFQSYGGGFYMNDATWIRTYNNKSFYHNSGILRTDGIFQVGPDGNRFIVNASGNVGIGLIDPGSAKLRVAGNVIIHGYSDGDMVDVVNNQANLPANTDLIWGAYGWGVPQPNNPRLFYLSNTGAPIFSVRNNGQVGINCDPSNSTFMLSVNGNIKAKEVEVTLEGWSDYVFNKDYNLMPIKELEIFINQNNHLPDVPSEKEIMEKGVNLGEMDSILLKKIEELTLYIIDLKKENDELSKRIGELEK